MRTPLLSRITSFVLLIVALTPLSASSITFNDGQLHVIDADNSFPFEGVRIFDGPGGLTTTVQVMEGGEIGTEDFAKAEVFDSSRFEMTGGEIYWLETRDTSTSVISGGQVRSLVIHGDCSSDCAPTMQISAGQFPNAIFTRRTSELTITGGDFNGVQAAHSSVISISGGRFSGASFPTIANDTAEIEISGGVFLGSIRGRASGNASIIGGEILGSLLAFENSVLSIFGSDFNHPLGDVVATSGRLTGTLSDGTPLDTDFGRASTGTITLVGVSACENADCSGLNTECSTFSCDPSGLPDNCDVVEFMPDGMACGNALDTVCDKPDTCDGSGSCLENFEPATKSCRDLAGQCDVEEFCDGAGGCPADAFLGVGIQCARPMGICDIAETCTGSSPMCPADGPNLTTLCRRAAGLCDVAEFCSDASDDCPANGLRPAGFVCNPGSGDVCDPDEQCTGSSVTCPADTFEPVATLCRAGSGDLCDPDEFCTGVADAACPADFFEPETTVCNPGSGDLCDPDELCPGVAGGACPADLFAAIGTVCNEGSGDFCDPDEVCSGVADEGCPADAFEPATTVCRAGSGDLCDLDELCMGIPDQVCPADVVASSGTVCNPGSGDLCDPDEVCSGEPGTTCPADVFAEEGTICRPGSGHICDPEEVCTGLADTSCPSDIVAAVGTACGDPASDACTLPDFCDGAGTCQRNDLACAVLTDESLCPADINLAQGSCVHRGLPTGEACDQRAPQCSVGTCEPSRQFRLAYEEDAQDDSFILSTSQPEQFAYNLLYMGPFPATLTISVPFPFVTQGRTPVSIFDGADLRRSGGCFTLPAPIATSTQQIMLEDYLGLPTSGLSCDLVCDPTGATPALGTCFGGGEDGMGCIVGDPDDLCVVSGGSCVESGFCSFELDVEDPGSGQVFVSVELDYGLEGEDLDANPCDDGLVDRYQPGNANLAFGGSDALASVSSGLGHVAVPNFASYAFFHANGSSLLTDRLENLNRIPEPTPRLQWLAAGAALALLQRRRRRRVRG